MRTTIPRLAVLALVTASCSGGGVDEPPASFAGVWSLTATNLSTARYVHCTGDMAPLEGMNLDGPGGENVTCYADVSPVIQSGSSVTLPPSDYSCDDGSYGSWYGRGTVTGKHIDYTETTSFDSAGIAVTDKFTGTKTSAKTFILDEWQSSVSGATNGSCNLSPRLRYDGEIVDLSRAAPGRREISGEEIRGHAVLELLGSLGKR